MTEMFAIVFFILSSYPMGFYMYLLRKKMSQPVSNDMNVSLLGFLCSICSNTLTYSFFNSAESRGGRTFQTNHQSWARSQKYWEKTNWGWRRNIRDWKGKTQLLSLDLNSQDNPQDFIPVDMDCVCFLVCTVFLTEMDIHYSIYTS